MPCHLWSAADRRWPCRCQVDEIGTVWGTFSAAVQSKDDVFDIYARQSGILHWHADPPEDEPEERTEPGSKGGGGGSGGEQPDSQAEKGSE